MRFLTIGSISFLLGLAACQPPPNAGTGSSRTNNAVQISLELAGEPKVGPVQVQVHLLRNNVAVTNAKVTVIGTMTHAGMEPVISQASEMDSSAYKTLDFSFTMAGDWILQAEVTLPNGSKANDVDFVIVPRS